MSDQEGSGDAESGASGTHQPSVVVDPLVVDPVVVDPVVVDPVVVDSVKVKPATVDAPAVDSVVLKPTVVDPGKGYGHAEIREAPWLDAQRGIRDVDKPSG